jgi:hypothetical protein
LRITDVRGTAAEAGVRKGDILTELDGNKVNEALSVFRIMSTKQPGDHLTVKVLRGGKRLDFVYNVMQREKTQLSAAGANPMQSGAPSQPAPDTVPFASPQNPEPVVSEPIECASWNRITVDQKGLDQKGILVAKRVRATLHVQGNSWPPPMNDPKVRMTYVVIMVMEMDSFCKQNTSAGLDAAFTQVAATMTQKAQTAVDYQKSQSDRAEPSLDPVYDPAYEGKTWGALGGPFLIKTTRAFLRKSGYYPWREILADGMFLFIDTSIFNNSDRPLSIPRFGLADSQGKTYATANRASLFKGVLSGGETINPGVNKYGYLIFDVPWTSVLPIRFTLLIANSKYTIDVNVEKREE